jgi:hypothetical protein
VMAPNVFSISGYNGRGIAPGTVFGRALADHVTGAPNALPLAEKPVTPDPWRNLKSAFYHAGAQAKHFIDRRFSSEYPANRTPLFVFSNRMEPFCGCPVEEED